MGAKLTSAPDTCPFQSPLQEEKCVRASQILENERRRERERREKKLDDQRVLKECKRALEEEKQCQVLRLSTNYVGKTCQL